MSPQDAKNVQPGAAVVNPEWTWWPHRHVDETIAALRKVHGVVPDWAIPADILWLVSLERPELLQITYCAARWGRDFATTRAWLRDVIGRLPVWRALQAQGGGQ